jgi:hypothetical protein
MYAVMKGNMFVSRKGSYYSYTYKSENAQTYNTLEEARRDCCGNEHVVILVQSAIYPVKNDEK